MPNGKVPNFVPFLIWEWKRGFTAEESWKLLGVAESREHSTPECEVSLSITCRGLQASIVKVFKLLGASWGLEGKGEVRDVGFLRT